MQKNRGWVWVSSDWSKSRVELNVASLSREHDTFSHLFPPRNGAGSIEIYNRARRTTKNFLQPGRNSVYMNVTIKHINWTINPKELDHIFPDLPFNLPPLYRLVSHDLNFSNQNDLYFLYCVEKLLGWCIFLLLRKCFFFFLNHIYNQNNFQIFSSKTTYYYFILLGKLVFFLTYFFFFNPINFKIWRIYIKIYVSS